MALQQAAAKAMALETARNAPSSSTLRSEGGVDQAALKASSLLEKAFTDLYKRIQDRSDKDNDWKAACIDRLENVHFYTSHYFSHLHLTRLFQSYLTLSWIHPMPSSELS